MRQAAVIGKNGGCLYKNEAMAKPLNLAAGAEAEIKDAPLTRMHAENFYIFRANKDSSQCIRGFLTTTKVKFQLFELSR